MRRIVVTGMGAVSPLGCGVELSWRRLLAGQSGLRASARMVAGAARAHCRSRARQGRRCRRRLRSGAGGRAKRPAQDGPLHPVRTARRPQRRSRRPNGRRRMRAALERTATIIASGVGGFPAMAEAVRTTEQRGARRLSPFTIPSFLANLAAGHVSIKHGYKGPLGTPVTACAAGVQAIGDAARMIRAGEADVAICGGAEACIDLVSHRRLCRGPRAVERIQRRAGARLAPVRSRPRRLCHGRRRGHPGDRGAGACAGARRLPDCGDRGLRHDGRRLSHDVGAAGRRRRPPCAWRSRCARRSLRPRICSI